MHRFYLPPEQTKGPTFTLTDREAHHAAQVLRIRKGDRLIVLNGTGAEFLCEAADVSKREVAVSVIDKKMVDPLPFALTLVQAIPKGKTIEWIIEKATELGAARVVPLLTERVVVHLDPKQAREKQEKWQMVAIEAAKQCGQAWLPKVELPFSLEDFLARNEKPELPLVGSLQNDSQHPRKFFETFQQREKRPPKSVCLYVGPEGDFTFEEIERIKASGAWPISLGKLVLRCETAAIYGLALVSYELTAKPANGI